MDVPSVHRLSPENIHTERECSHLVQTLFCKLYEIGYRSGKEDGNFLEWTKIIKESRELSPETEQTLFR